MPGQVAAHVNGVTVPMPGRAGFKAEFDSLRERMRGFGLGYDDIAAEMGRRYRMRPREAYRVAYGLSLDQAAALFNEMAAREGADPQGRASMTKSHLCEHEKWPYTQRKPSVYFLAMLAKMYETDVLRLLDLHDYEKLPAQDRLVLIGRPQAETPFGVKLISLMEQRGRSLRELARRVPCDAGYLSDINHGRKRVSESMARRLDDVLNAGGELIALADIPSSDGRLVTAKSPMAMCPARLHPIRTACSCHSRMCRAGS